jgi:3-hydroxybutyryl-CoA dehydrogenase
MKRVCLFGESPLVEEYASLLLNKGCTVAVRLNGGSSSKTPLPRGIRKTNVPVKAIDAALELTNTDAAVKRENIRALDRALPSGIPILTSAVTVALAEQAGWTRHPGRLIGIGALPSLLEGSLVEICTLETTSATAGNSATELMRHAGKETALVSDGVGMVLPRILCMIVNEAFFAMQEGVAPGRDIDTAMKLGTNYPRGPVEWAERIGLAQVQAVLSALYAAYGDDRYRLAPLLRRSAFRTPGT